MADKAAAFNLPEPLQRGKRIPNLFFNAVHDRNVNSVRALMEAILPVRYSDDFYKNLTATPFEFTKMGKF
jgi:hypothetical protein